MAVPDRFLPETLPALVTPLHSIQPEEIPLRRLSDHSALLEKAHFLCWKPTLPAPRLFDFEKAVVV